MVIGRRTKGAAALLAGALAAGMTTTASCEETPDRARERDRMVREQIEARGVANPRVLEAMRRVPRHRYVPPGLEEAAYRDGPLPIGQGQTISQPFIVASMTELVDPQPGDTILEVGTGSGYQAAVLGELVERVYTIEIVVPLASAARERLRDEGYSNVTVITGDGYAGLPEHAPYDGIVVTAAPPELPAALAEQLAVGAKLVIPVGRVDQELRVVERTKEGLEERGVYPVRFVPLVRGEDR